MDDIKKMLFLQQKFQILALFTNPNAERNVTSSYAYAWDRGVYPLLNDGAKWHQPYKDQFDIKEEPLERLLKLLDDRWMAKNPITFYELEDHYQLRDKPIDGWERYKLINACRYFYLHDSFDKAFWVALLKSPNCPSEATNLARDLEIGDIYFE